MNIDTEKKELRKKIKELKSQVSSEEKLKRSEIIFQKIESLNIFQESQYLLAYWSMPDEVQTHQFVERWYEKKVILLPCVEGENLVLRRFEGEAKMKNGEQFNIKEPVGEIFTELNLINLAIIPGVAFDKENNRLGRGRAFYDRLLPQLNCYKIGVCFDFQLLEKIPSDKFDIKMDFVISDNL